MKNNKKSNPFKWKHYEGEIIIWLVRWYCRYALSYKDLKEIAQERGKIRGKWFYLYRAIDKNVDTLDWMLSRYRNKKSAKRFFKKTLNNPYVKEPRVIIADKSPTFPPAIEELQNSGEFPANTKLRRIKYLNNSMENDHKSTKSKSRYRQWYQSFSTASKTIDGMESMRCLQKGQVRKVAKGDICAQNSFINELFDLVA